MQIKTQIEVLSDKQVRLTQVVRHGKRVRATRIYHVAKLPPQSADEVCRAVCPEAFPDTVPGAVA